MWERIGRSAGIIGLSLAVACSSNSASESGGVRKTRQAITTEGARVLGFEAPVQDWTPLFSSPAVAQSNSQLTQGSASLALSGGGWMSIASPRLAKQGPTPEAITLDIRLPALQPNPFWFGAVEIYLDAPSIGLNQALAGQVALTGLPIEQWSTLTFGLPAFVRSALDGNWTDLRIQVVVNVPSDASGTYHIDRMTFGVMCTPQDDGDPCTADACDGATGQTTHTVLPSCPGSPSGETGANAGILGFEVTGFTATSGTSLTQSSEHVEGAHSLAATAFQNAIIESPALSTLAAVTDTVGFDLFLPFEPFGPPVSGSVQLFLHAPSRNVHNAWIGQKNLDGAILGRFRRVEFKVPESIRSVLATGQYNDLRFRIQVDLPASATGPILFDRFTFHQHAVEPPVPVPSLDTERTLGFETAANWRISAGNLALSDEAVQGDYAIAISAFTHAELTSARMATLGPTDGKLRFDLRVPDPADPYWSGWVNAFISIPSKGVNNQFIGGTGLTGLTPHAYHRVAFDVPTSLRSTLETAVYSDLTVGLTFDVPQGTAPIQVDSMSLGEMSFFRPEPPAVLMFDVDLPNGVALDDVTLYNGQTRGFPMPLGGLAVIGPAEVRHPTNTWGALVSIEQLLLAAPEAASAVETGGIYAMHTHRAALRDVPPNPPSSIQLHNGSGITVHGQARSELAISEIGGSATIASRIPQANFAALKRVPWQIEIPQDDGAVNPVVNAGQMVGMVPGVYDLLEVHDGGSATFGPGTYVFDRINLHPGSTLELENVSVEPIVIISRGRMEARGATVAQDELENNVFWINAGNNAQTSNTRVDVVGSFFGSVLGGFVSIGTQDGSQTTFRGRAFSNHFGLHVSNAVLHHLPFSELHCDDGCVLSLGCSQVDDDQDGLGNCEEDNDGKPWTKRSAFNGVRTTHGDPCGDPGSCGTIDTLAEVNECLANMTLGGAPTEASLQYDGWDGASPDSFNLDFAPKGSRTL